MTTAIAHRGPDDQGVHVDGPVGLGNRRLAIIDLSPAGHQPMANEAGDLVITYNGEIYNFRELRAELERLGHRFRSRTRHRGRPPRVRGVGRRAALERFNGMFAFAVWDRATAQQLFLARDRYGIKPLYYTEVGADFLFASEIKALPRGTRRSASRVSLPHLLEYFTFQNIFSDGTLFDGVRLLPARPLLTISARRTARRRLHRYWDFRFHEETTASDRRGVRGGARPPLPPGGRAAARQRRARRRVPERRHGLRVDHRDRGRSRSRT